jgi:hypothetical protein
MHVEVDVEPVQCSRSRADAYGGNVVVLAYISGVGQAKVLKLAGSHLGRSRMFCLVLNSCTCSMIGGHSPHARALTH